MTLQETQNALSTIKKGAMVKVHYQTINGDYSKDTQTIVRFVKYANIKGVQVQNKANPNESHDGIYEAIIYNSNKNEYYLQMATIKTRAKSKVIYYHLGQEITQSEYEQANPSKPRTQPLIVFRKNIKDIISIG